MHESAENELKENSNGFGYLFDVKIIVSCIISYLVAAFTLLATEVSCIKSRIMHKTN